MQRMTAHQTAQSRPAPAAALGSETGPRPSAPVAAGPVSPPTAGGLSRGVPPVEAGGAGLGRVAPLVTKRKRRPKDIGTDAERAVVRYLTANGWPGAERRALRGISDAGDITGTPGICWEVKGGQQARTASDGQIDAWLTETAAEKLNAAADVAVLVVQRKGVGPGNAGRWWAIMPAYQLEGLMNGTGRWHLGARFPVRMTLADVTGLLRATGYGDPLEVLCS